MRNFNEGVDPIINTGLAGLATANTLKIKLIDQQESDLDPTMTWASVTQTAATATFTIGSLTCASRIINLGASTWTETTPTTARAFAVVTPDATPKLVAVQNITDGTAWNAATLGPPILDGLSIKVAYQAEA